MAEYRQIHTRIWKDGWFIDLAPEEKLLFVYLFSNERASIAGIYELPLKIMCFESGLSEKITRAALAKFSKAGKVHYDDGRVWVVNLRRYNENTSPKVAARITKDLDDIPDCKLKQLYLEYHSHIPGDGYGIHTVSIPYSESISEQEQEQEQERGASATPQKVIKPKPKEPAAVSAFREAAGAYPPKTLWDSMAEAVGSTPGDLEFWGAVVRAWIAKGYNPKNVLGMFDFYKRRELPASNGAPASERPFKPGTVYT